MTVFGIPLANRHRLIVPRCRLNTYTVVGLFRLLVRQSGTHCQMNSDIQCVMSTASNSSLRQSFSAFSSATSALEVIFERYALYKFEFYLVYLILYIFCSSEVHQIVFAFCFVNFAAYNPTFYAT